MSRPSLNLLCKSREHFLWFLLYITAKDEAKEEGDSCKMTMAVGFSASLLKLPLCFLLLSATLSEALLIEEKPAIAFWKENLPGVVMPKALRDLASPLSPSLTRLYLMLFEKGSILANSLYGGICSSAEIYCSSKAKHNQNPLVCIPFFEYSYGLGKHRCKNSASNIFFTRNKLKRGASFSYPNLTNALTGQHFLPKTLTDALPFYIDGIMVVQSLLGIQDAGGEMKKTLQQCAAPATSGEIKECSTSLESMIFFVKRNLGSKLKVYSSSTWKPRSNAQVKELSEVSPLGRKVIFCHNLEYPYLIYSCHMSKTSRVMEVAMVEEQREAQESKVMAICHSNTKAWNPEHIAFQVLQNVKPGDGNEICHWLPVNHFIWTGSTS